jgi:hypothetical protein
LVILEILDNDITNNVALLCPNNSYKSNVYNAEYGTIILLKKDKLYEPIYAYGSTPKNKNRETISPVIKIFKKQDKFDNLTRIFNIISKTTKNNCRAFPIKSAIYEYEENISASDIVTILIQNKYVIQSQVLNYRGKVIALMVVERKEDNNPIYVPTYPSATQSNIPIIYIDDVQWLSYAETYERLNEIKTITNGKLLCAPIKRVIEDGFIVGILTETNQFIPISQLEQNSIMDDLTDSKHHVVFTGYKDNGYYDADKKLATSDISVKDNIRVKTIQNISLETHFYVTFRNKIRILLNEYYNKDVRKTLFDVLNDTRYLYHVKLAKIEILLKYLLRNAVSFDNFNPDALSSLQKMTTIVSDYDTKKLCLIKQNKVCIPKNNLVSNENNETLYFSRIADELIRYNRVRLFMLEPKRYLNITTTEFKLNDDEMLLLQSVLYSNYFDDLVPYDMNKYIQSITYEIANPSNQKQYYSNEISLDEQLKNTSTLQLLVKECIAGSVDIIGEIKSKFTERAKEHIIGNSTQCSYFVLIYVLKNHSNVDYTINMLKDELLKAYSIVLKDNKSEVYDRLSREGKSDAINKIKQNILEFDAMIMDELYTLTLYDVWLITKQMNLPIIIIDKDSRALYMGGDRAEDKFYFVRYTDTMRYHLITPSVKLDTIDIELLEMN